MHYFLASGKDGLHHLIFLNNLIENKLIDPKKTLLLILNASQSKDIRALSKEIKIKHIDINFKLSLEPDDTFTTISITRNNCTFLEHIIQSNHDYLNQFYCLITDDEVDRWNNHFSNNKKNSNVTDKEISCAKKITNFISEKEPWARIIKKYVNKDANILDILPPFTILEKNIESQIKKIHKSEVSDEFKLMIFTKKKLHSEYLEVLSIISKKLKSFSGKKIVVFLWADPLVFDLRLALHILFLKIIAKKKSNSIQINFMQKIDYVSYFSVINDQDIIFAQPRGGGSAIRAAIKAGANIFFKKNSLNADNFLNFSNDQSISYYHDFDLKKKSINGSNLLDNLLNKENASLIKLNQIYGDK